MEQNTKLHILLGLFVGLIVGMNLLGGKIISLFGVSVSVAIFVTPLTFLITDVVAEVFGRKITKHFVYSGILTLAILFLYTFLFVNLEPHERYTTNDEYVTIFGSSLRIIIASLVAFSLAQMHDIWAFHFWRRKTKGRFLWFRNNLSTFVSQFIDTTAFMFIAFYQLTPKFTFEFVFSLIIPYYLFKLAFAVIDTPLVYLGVRWLRGIKVDEASKNVQEAKNE